MQPVIGGSSTSSSWWLKLVCTLPGSSLHVALPEHQPVMLSHSKAGGLLLQSVGDMLSSTLATRQDTPGRLEPGLRHLPSFGLICKIMYPTALSRVCAMKL